MTYPEQNVVDAMRADAACPQHDDKTDATQNGRRANRPDQAGPNWAWAQNIGHYDWMDSHAPFIDRS
jgi:hypothetical protein